MPAVTGRSIRTCVAAASLLSLPPLGAQTAQPLTLKAAYDAALAFDAQYLASTHELESARQQIPQARALLLPNVGLTASASPPVSFGRRVARPASPRVSESAG